MSRRRSMLFASGKLPEGWHYVYDAPAESAYLALWYKGKIVAVELNGYWDADNTELTSNIMGILAVSALNGVEYRYIYAPETSGNTLPWSTTTGVVARVTTTTSGNTAITDMLGEANTYALHTGKGGVSSVASNTLFNLFPNGSPGFAGGAGNTKVFMNVRTSFNNIATKFGITALPSSSYYWTSTQNSSANAWRFIFSGTAGVASSAAKSGTNFVRRMMSIPQKGGEFVALDFDYDSDWKVVDGFRESPTTTVANDAYEEKILISANTHYQRVRVYAYVGSHSNSRITVGKLDTPWSATGGWTKQIEWYHGNHDNPAWVDIDVPTYGEHYIVIRAFLSLPGEKVYYKVINIDDLPNEIDYSYNFSAMPYGLRAAASKYLVMFNYNSGLYRPSIIMNAPKSGMMVRLFCYPVTYTTNPSLFFSEINSSVAISDYKAVSRGTILPPSLPSYIDYDLVEGENVINLLLNQTANQNAYFFLKLSEHFYRTTIEYIGDWIYNLDGSYGYYESPIIDNSEQTIMRINFDVVEEAGLTYRLYYHTNSQAADKMYIGNLDVAIDNVSNYRVSMGGIYYAGEDRTIDFEIPFGSHFIEVMYIKDSSGSTGQDKAYFYLKKV